jgi:hypothetical protein
MLAQTHGLKKAALRQSLFHKLRPGDEETGVTLGMPDVDHHSILNGMVVDDIPGIRNDGVALREGGNDVRIDQNAVLPDEKESQYTSDDDYDQQPRQAVSMLGHFFNISFFIPRGFELFSFPQF